MRSALASALLLGLLAAAAGAEDDPEYVKQCRARCNALRSRRDFREYEKTGCQSFMTQLPKPRVFDTCRFGFNQAKGRVCDLVCEYPEIRCDGSLLDEPSIADRMREGCGPLRKRRPAPLMFHACEGGYKAATMRLCEELKHAEEPHLEEREAAQDREREAAEAAEAARAAAAAREKEARATEQRTKREQEAATKQQRAAAAAAAAAADQGPEAQEGSAADVASA